MAQYFKMLALYLMNEKCYDNYFMDFNFFDVPCFKALLSKGLGLGIIAGSVLVKVPQIVKILSNKSGEGINIFSVVLDLFAITVHVSYSFVNGFPFSAWGDGTFLALQTATIAALVLHFAGSTAKSAIFLVLYSTLCYVLMGGLTPLEYLWSAQAFNVPILFVGKMIQAITNYRNQSTGQLSAVTCFLLFAGSMARIFTSVQETGDSMMIITYCVSTCANAVIIAQLIYYGRRAAVAEKPHKNQKVIVDKAQKQQTNKKVKSKKAD